MLALVVALAATIVLTPPARASLAPLAEREYTVWSSVVLTRTGERTPQVLGDLPTELTSLGARQAFAAGAFFRNRYITANDSSANGGVGPIFGLKQTIISNLQLYVSTLDYQWTAATAQAFIQGLYPPVVLNSSLAIDEILDPTSVTADSEYVAAPLEGYQYPQIHSAGGLDPNFVYLSANLDCPAFDMAAAEYYDTHAFTSTESEYKSIFDAIGSGLLSNVLDPSAWDDYNAYAIFDYLNYQNSHNNNFSTALAGYRDAKTNTSYFDIIRWLADEQQYAELGNLSAVNPVSNTDLPNNATGSISTIAGNMLAAKVLGQLQNAIEWEGDYFKLNLLFSDFAPFVSFFAVNQMPALDTNFYGLPDFASSAVFELYSYTNNSMSMAFPSTDDLWVRFYFRNGSDSSAEFHSHPLFGRGPDSTDMTWREFEAGMYELAVSNVGDWCLQCGAENLFCAAWNASDGALGSSSSLSGSHRHDVSPVVGGVIGAVVTLAVASLLFAAAMLLGGVRMHRVTRQSRSEMGGFKGGRKMASDQDLTIPKTKSGAVVQSTVEQEDPMSPVGGHERIGSWEMKEAEAGRGGDAREVRVPSFETERGVEGFAEPVKAKEGV